MFERKKRARTLAVPTEDKKVRERLREMGEPVCLFGEDVRFIWLFELSISNELVSLNNLKVCRGTNMF